MKIAIIGSSGFIGRHLVKALSQQPENHIFLFGRSKESTFGTSYPYAQINLENKDQVSAGFKGMDLVYYLVSETIPASTWEKPLAEVEKNLIPFISSIERMAVLNVRKVVFISSAGTIYGQSTEKMTEESPKHPFAPYGIIKLTMEHFLHYFQQKYNLQYDVFRVSNVYGPGQDTTKGLGIINTFLERIIKHGNVEIFGTGNIVRNYIYVKDVAELLCLSAKTGIEESRIYNLASNDTLQINELVSVIRTVTKADFKVSYRDNRKSDNPAILLSNEKIKRDFKEFRFTSLAEGVSETYQFITEQK